MITASMAEAKTNLSKIARTVNETGVPVTVMKGSKPWIQIVPLAYESGSNDPEQDAALKEAEEIKADPQHERFDAPQDFFSAMGI